jgi:hypothetical protein
MTETLEQVQRLVTHARTGRHRRLAHGVVQKRAPSGTAKRAVDAFGELRRFFRTSVQLRAALRWSSPTLRVWTVGQGPARPRAHSVERVFLILDVARAAKRWVSDPYQVGDWLLEPNASLGDVTPAQVIDGLGREGAEGLIKHMALIAPRERVSLADVDLDADALREALQQLEVPAITDIERSGELDLSDLDFE